MRYNQYHDQLVLSSSSDGHVVLASMASISSEPHGHLIEEEDDLDGSVLRIFVHFHYLSAIFNTAYLLPNFSVKLQYSALKKFHFTNFVKKKV